MLLFIITLEHESAKLLQCFNTSHVVIYLKIEIVIHRIYARFNTSHVVIYLKPFLYSGRGQNLFQYISCCYLSSIEFKIGDCVCSFNTSHVVIYQILSISSCLTNLISIHLMLLFILLSIVSQSNHTHVSIHLMLLFIRAEQRV